MSVLSPRNQWQQYRVSSSNRMTKHGQGSSIIILLLIQYGESRTVSLIFLSNPHPPFPHTDTNPNPPFPHTDANPYPPFPHTHTNPHPPFPHTHQPPSPLPTHRHQPPSPLPPHTHQPPSPLPTHRHQPPSPLPTHTHQPPSPLPTHTPQPKSPLPTHTPQPRLTDLPQWLLTIMHVCRETSMMFHQKKKFYNDPKSLTTNIFVLLW